MVELKGTKPIDAEGQWVFMTITVEGDACKFTHVAPAHLTGQALQDYVDAEEGRYKLDILKDIYPDCPAGEKIDLAKMEDWIANGRVIPAKIDEETGQEIAPETQADKVPFKRTHPPEIAAKAQFEAAKTVAEKVQVLADHIFGN